MMQKERIVQNMKIRLALMATILALMVAGADPAAYAHEEVPTGEEIVVTGVIKDAPDKADGTPAYGITDESTLSGTAPPIGYILEGDYSAYVGQRVTVYGVPRQSGEYRVLDVTRIV